MEGIERVDGQLDENRTGSSRLSGGQSFPHGGHDLPHRPDRGAELAQRLEEGHLVDVLQRSPALDHETIMPGGVRREMQTVLTFPGRWIHLQEGAGRSTQEQQRRFCHLRVLHGGHCVGESRTCRHGCHTHSAW